MNFRILGLAIATFVSGNLDSTQGRAQNAYITNIGSNTVSVIDTTTNLVTATIAGPAHPGTEVPLGVAVTADGSKVYVTNLEAFFECRSSTRLQI